MSFGASVPSRGGEACRRARALRAARRVRLLALDVDGVLTDGGLDYDDAGRVAKRFHAQDGLGLKVAQATGLHIAVISGLTSAAVSHRVSELGIRDYFPGHRHKVDVLGELLRQKGLGWEEAAFLGDDWVDCGPLRQVGLPMCVADAQPETRRLALWRAASPGGRAAVREAVRFILLARGELETALASFLDPGWTPATPSSRR